MGAITKWINLTSISVVLFAIYFGFTVQQFYQIMYPTFINTEGPTLDPLWPESQALHAEFYLSPRAAWEVSDFNDPQVVVVGNFSELSYDWQDNERSAELEISRSALQAFAEASRPDEQPVVWRAIRSNNSVYLHVHVTHNRYDANPSATNYHRLATVHQSHPLIKFAPRPNAKNATYLLEPYFPHWYPPPPSHSEQYDEFDANHDFEKVDPTHKADVISFWKPHMAIRLVTDFKQYPYQEIPALVYHNLRYEQMKDKSYKYLPSMYLDDMGLTMEKLVPLNQTVRALPLKISYEPMSYARWQVLLTMEMAFKSQEAMGFANQDLDSMRSMLADTNPYLLAVTMTVSLLHILFDWLAFKNDISDWRQKTTEWQMVGVSLRSMVITLVSQVIICLYLMEEKATLLILAPSVLSLLLLVWKIFKVWRATRSAPTKTTTPTTSAVSTTQQADAMATNHLLFVLIPLVVGYASYSLIHKQHLSWYNWLLGSLTGAVYAFGFVLMTPQLVINYQLKSVAHLQWRYLIYRALNTFIDDLFAFIIHMPTMHRLSCFRDDIIFLIYVYQRWIYPVDTSRKFDDDDGSDAAHSHKE
ncbi:hypothetical protein Poli38472_006900 [Pythium oligandrum]|uniref:Cleft lip and palate associated transmembrane protein n=1 Tax=Pythium oligandrum TaxID=41045 RepID=A0A8K1FCV5_PYTOL|nr:hypothetical protein Poli38472_006900 [Pythium oligandrum]|eukprot:TMW58755.1 hypothetical protein Poli38472_006900 [Pythium oligandrum]